MSRLALVALASLAGAGCASPTWQRHAPGAALPEDKVVLVGSFTAVPPIQQRGNRAPGGGTWVGNHYEPPGRVVFVGEQEGNVAAIFTPDLAEPWRQDTLGVPFGAYDWAWIPMDGYFAIEVPRREHLYLRGVFYVTDGGAVRIELPAQVDLRRDDRVVYVGEIRLVRTGERRIVFNDRTSEARKAFTASGYGGLVSTGWRTRLPRLLPAADTSTSAAASR